MTTSNDRAFDGMSNEENPAESGPDASRL